MNRGPWKPCELISDIKMRSLCHKTGSSGHLATNLQSGSNEIQIEATATDNPTIKTIVSATVNITEQGMYTQLFGYNK